MAAKKAAEAFEVFAAKPEAFKEGYERMTKGFANAAEFNKSTVEALMASAGALSRTIEQTTSEQNAFLKSAYEDGVAAFRAASGSKSLQEAIDVQTDYLRDAFGKQVAQLSKISELWLATSKEAAEPLTRRYGELVEIFQSYRP